MRGDESLAGELQDNELEPARAALSSADPALTSPAAIAALLAREEARAADAAMLAELLAPQLLARLGAPTSAAVADTAVPVRRATPAPLPTPASRPPPVRSTSIADLIDGMLAEDRLIA